MLHDLSHSIFSPRLKLWEEDTLFTLACIAFTFLGWEREREKGVVNFLRAMAALVGEGEGPLWCVYG